MALLAASWAMRYKLDACLGVVQNNRPGMLQATGNIESFGQVGRQVLQRAHQAIRPQLDRMQRAGKFRVNSIASSTMATTRSAVAGSTVDLLASFFCQHLDCQGGGRQMLSQTVMQIMADPPLFSFRDFQEFPLQSAALPDFLPQVFRPLIHQIRKWFRVENKMTTR